MFCKCRTVFFYFKILTKFTCKRIRAKIGLKWFYFKHEIYVNKKYVSEIFQNVSLQIVGRILHQT